jgi:hypothetical protein
VAPWTSLPGQGTEGHARSGYSVDMDRAGLPPLSFHVLSHSFRVVPPLSFVSVATGGRGSARRCRRRRRWRAGGALRAGMAAARAEQGNCGSSDRGSHATPAMRASHPAVIPLASPKDTSEQSLLYVLTGFSTPSQALLNDFGEISQQRQAL